MSNRCLVGNTVDFDSKTCKSADSVVTTLTNTLDVNVYRIEAVLFLSLFTSFFSCNLCGICGTFFGTTETVCTS